MINLSRLPKNRFFSWLGSTYRNMEIEFYKYQGAGNDFILLDQRLVAHISREDTEFIRFCCDRRFGIGADGLILLRQAPDYDFEMIYFNADGSESTLCGNGGRCIVRFAHDLGMIQHRTRFLAIDGGHEAVVGEQPDQVQLQLADVDAVRRHGDDYILNTGSPHLVRFVDELDHFPVVDTGRFLRNQPDFWPGGINVNFARESGQALQVRTYERGVEDETLACGTGVAAAALAAAVRNHLREGSHTTRVVARGGELHVSFHKMGNGSFRHIWLSGPAKPVFKGTITLDKRHP
jgi:diaminopimelate epimerase